jgi:hypothetical protein
MRKSSYANISARLSQTEREKHLLMMALQLVTIDTPTLSLRATDAGWTYWVRAYNLTGAHGGIIVVRAKCLTNDQRDSVTAYYLDDASDRLPFDQTPNLHARIRDVFNARHHILFPEFACSFCGVAIHRIQSDVSRQRADNAQPACKDCVTAEVTKAQPIE